MRSRACSKSLNCARPRNSPQIEFQNRSTLPRVIGWCGRERMCDTRSLAISFWKRLDPRQAAYWRPLSVSISLGTPNSPAARR